MNCLPWMLLLFVSACCSSILAEQSNADKPLIVWWYKTVFPHVEKDGVQFYSVICENEWRCDATHNRSMVSSTDMTSIIFYGSDFEPDDLPLPRQKHQMWALLHEESPQNSFLLWQWKVMELFNFSSTFKSSSDYPLTTQYVTSVDYLHKRKAMPLVQKNRYRERGMAPIIYVQSNCDVPSDRDRYVAKLMEYIQVDSYGECLHNKDFEGDKLHGMESLHNENFLDLMSKYKFHIAFENAICDDYITEKLYRALHVGSVPIYLGAPNVGKWSPKNSVIEVKDFASPEALSNYIRELDENEELYLRYLEYKKDKSTLPESMVKVLRERNWSTDDPTLPHFVSGFECFVCEEMHKMQQSGAPEKDKSFSGLGTSCPSPQPSTGEFKKLSKSEKLHAWIEDFYQSTFIAEALHKLVRQNMTDAKKVWEMAAKLMIIKQGRDEL